MARRLVTVTPGSSPRAIDLPALIKGLTAATDAARMAKVTRMLRAECFQLFSAVSDDHLTDVVKSQTDVSLVYACRLARDGGFFCCTQNLMPCGGLRGALCKHILVLVIGTAQSGALDAAAANAWASASRTAKPVLDKHAATTTLARHQRAESGELDWRPTETTPDDYAAL
jgi:hypothetical protein